MATARIIPDINGLPDSAFLRLWAILALLQISRSTWYWWIGQGRAPKPVRIGMRAVGWRVGDIRPLLAGQADTPVDPKAAKAARTSIANRKARKAAQTAPKPAKKISLAAMVRAQNDLVDARQLAERAEAARLEAKRALLGEV